MAAQENRKSRVVRAGEWGLILAFLLGLAAPGLRATLDGWRHRAANELREPVGWPERGPLPEMAAGIEAFFEDRLGFRGPLLALHGRLRAQLLATSPSPQVLLGREGWLFFNGSRGLREEDRVVHQARGARQLDAGELAAHRERFGGRQRDCATQGIPYLLVIAPNKHTIYGEYLPEAMNRVSERTPLDQTLAVLAESSDVPVLDLRSPLRAEKDRGLLYYRTDSHWNALGAQVATRQILLRLQSWLPSLAPRPLSHFALHWEAGSGDTLARLIALPGAYREDVPTLTPREPPRWRERPDAFDSPWFEARPKLRDWFLEQGLFFRVYEVEDPNLPHALFLVDSFGAWLMEPLAEHFQTATFLHRRTPNGIVRRVVRELQPDVVVEEMAERSLVAE